MSIQIFAINDSQELGKLITDKSHELVLAKHEERNFEDGEHKIRPLESVRGSQVFVIHSLFSDELQSVNDKICHLLFFIGALKDAAADKVHVMTPYFAYARKDRKTKSRDPITMRYMAQIIEAVGADSVTTIDVHNLAAYQNAFRIPTEHLEAQDLFALYIVNVVGDEQLTIVSPDEGGLKRADKLRERLSELLDREVGRAFLMKKRNEDEVTGGNEIIGNVKGRFVIIVDDMISSGRTMRLAAEALHKQGAHKIWACATHGLFVGKANEILASPLFEKILISNSVHPFRLNEELRKSKVEILDVSQLLAEAIKRIAGRSPD